MLCGNCKKEFEYTEGLKFCPYCGCKINIDFVPREAAADEEKDLHSEAKLGNTLDMPKITDEQIKEEARRKRAEQRAIKLRQYIDKAKVIVKDQRFLLTAATVLVVILVAIIGSKFFLSQKVNEADITSALTGKVITLPKGTKFEIQKDNIKSVAITDNKKDKDTEKVTAKFILINTNLKVTGTLQAAYKEVSKNSWKLNGDLNIDNNMQVEPLAGVNEEGFINLLKGANVTIGNETIALSDKNIKSINIVDKKTDFPKSSEEVTAEVTLDSGIASSKGKLKCKLIFNEENWQMTNVDRVSNDDFKLSPSQSLSKDKLAQLINKNMNENVSYGSIFDGKAFNVNDKFTKDISITDFKYGEDNEINVFTSRNLVMGVLSAVITKNYVYRYTFSNITLVSEDKASVSSASLQDINKKLVADSIANKNVDMGEGFLSLWTDNHELSKNEAESFTLDEVLSKKNSPDTKYVYGKITYDDGGNDNIVIIYKLNYDNSSGYSWKVDSIIGSEADKYKSYSKDKIK